jgi:hypothetical protein
MTYGNEDGEALEEEYLYTSTNLIDGGQRNEISSSSDRVYE